MSRDLNGQPQHTGRGDVGTYSYDSTYTQGDMSRRLTNFDLVKFDNYYTTNRNDLWRAFGNSSTVERRHGTYQIYDVTTQTHISDIDARIFRYSTSSRSESGDVAKFISFLNILSECGFTTGNATQSGFSSGQENNFNIPYGNAYWNTSNVTAYSEYGVGYFNETSGYNYLKDYDNNNIYQMSIYKYAGNPAHLLSDGMKNYWWLGHTNDGYIIKCCFIYDEHNAIGFFQLFALKESTIVTLSGMPIVTHTPVPSDDLGFPSLPIGQAGEIVKRKWDEMTTPDEPTMSVSTSGLINVYKVTRHDLRQFGAKLFKTSQRTSYEGDNALENIGIWLNNIDKGLNDTLKGDLTQFVLDTHIIPVTPHSEDTKSSIKIGGYELDSYAYNVTSDYITFDCGTITVPKCYDDFNDYNGTRYKLMLPFVGFVDVNPNYITSSNITVKYRFNVLDGTFACFVSSNVIPDRPNTHSIIGVYNGSCCVHMPITGSNYSTVVNGLLQTVGGVATGIATGNPLTSLGGVLGGLGQMSHGNFTQSNQYNSSASFMGVRKPFLLIERPCTNLATNFYERNGALVMSTFKLNDLRGSGFTSVVNANMSTFSNWKESEKNEIKRLLEQGVYL